MAHSVDDLELRKDNHPVDKGWAWIILIGCTSNFILFVGTQRAFGLFFVEFLAMFDANVSLTSMIAGLMQGFYSVFSLPLMAIGLRFFSARQLMILGGCMGTISYALDSVAPNVYFLLFSHGIVNGFAFACIHGPCFYIVGQYFDKRRNLANAFLAAGGSTGGLILPSVYRYLMDMYGVRGALLITASLIFHINIGAMLMRPLSLYDKIRIPNTPEIVYRRTKHILNGQSKSSDAGNIECFKETHFKESKTSKVHHESAETKSLCSVPPNYANQECNDKSMSNSINVNAGRGRSEPDLKIYETGASLLISDVEESEHQPDQEVKFVNKKRNCFPLFCIKVDLSILRNPAMMLFQLVYGFGSIAPVYGAMYVAAFAGDVGILSKKIALVLSTICACDVVGRLLCGVIVDRRVMTNSYLMSTTLILTGINMQLFPLAHEFWSIMLFSILHGFFSGGIFALTPGVLVDLFGFGNFPSAMGISTFSQGIALASAAPFIGFLRDETKTYSSSFLFMGVCAISAGLVFLFRPVIERFISNINRRSKAADIV